MLNTASSATKETELWQALSDEDKQLPVLSFSQAQAFGSCQFAWEIEYKMGYTAPQSKALYLGTILHAFMADFYTRLMDDPSYQGSQWLSEVLPEMVETLLQASEHGETMVNVSQAAWLMQRYLEIQTMADRNFTVLAVEKHFISKLTTPKGRDFLMQAYVDLLLQDKGNGNIWLVDHKSGQKFWTPMECLMDPQMPTYCASLMDEGIKVFGIMLNQINTYDYKRKNEVDNEKLFKREMMHRTSQEVHNVRQEFIRRADDILDAREATQHLPRSLRKDCGKYCKFPDPCLMGLKGMPIEVILEDTFQRKEKKQETPANRGHNDVGISLVI